MSDKTDRLQPILDAVIQNLETRAATNRLDAILEAVAEDCDLPANGRPPTADDLKRWEDGNWTMPKGCFDIVKVCTNALRGNRYEEEMPIATLISLIPLMMRDHHVANLIAMHDFWKLTRESDGNLPHPLQPMIEAWAWRPVDLPPPDKAPAGGPGFGILPAPFVKALDPAAMTAPAVIRTGTDGQLPQLGLIRRPDAQLPLWPEFETEAAMPALVLAMLDAGSDRKPGASAPIRDRLFVEALMATAATTRNNWHGREGRTVLSVGELCQWLAWDPKHYRPATGRGGQALENAMLAANSVTIPINNHGGRWLPVHFGGWSGLGLTDRVALSLSLPAGSEYGAGVNRALLREFGRDSAVRWRLYLSLCFAWNRIAWHGKVPHLDRPEHLRDNSGNLLDANGELILGKGGAPIRDPRKTKRAVKTGNREPNKAGRLHKTYELGDIQRMVWPLLTQSTGKNPRRSRQQAVNAALAIEAAGGCQIIREGKITHGNPHGFPWRILPPTGNKANGGS